MAAQNQASTVSGSLSLAAASISPTCNPQTQCPLFTKLPAEIRTLIYEYVLSEEERPCQSHFYHRTYWATRPGHSHPVVIDTALLRTCQFIYHEARKIPIQSVTHHVHGYRDNDESAQEYPIHPCTYIFYLPHDIGAQLYHLHYYVPYPPIDFTEFLQPHLRWRKMTWTFTCLEDEPKDDKTIHDLPLMAAQLRQITFPSSCKEVNIEFEYVEELTLHQLPESYREEHLPLPLHKFDSHFRIPQLLREDNEPPLLLDNDLSGHYAFDGRVRTQEIPDEEVYIEDEEESSDEDDAGVDCIMEDYQDEDTVMEDDQDPSDNDSVVGVVDNAYTEHALTWVVRRLCWRAPVLGSNFRRVDASDCLMVGARVPTEEESLSFGGWAEMEE